MKAFRKLFETLFDWNEANVSFGFILRGEREGGIERKKDLETHIERKVAFSKCFTRKLSILEPFRV